MEITYQRSGAANLIRGILTEPFHASTWKRLAFILLAVPIGLLCVPLALIGGPAGRIQVALARRLLGTEITPRRRHWIRSVALTVLSVPINLAAVIVSSYFWTVVVLNLGYPLRPDNDYHTAWGGPTLAGAWAFHALVGGVVFFFLTAWVMRGFTTLQARLIRGFLGQDSENGAPETAVDRNPGLVRTTLLALGTALVCAVIAVPVIHQL